MMQLKYHKLYLLAQLTLIVKQIVTGGESNKCILSYSSTHINNFILQIMHDTT